MIEEKKQNQNPSSQPTTHTLTRADELKRALKKCQEEKNEYLKGWQRERADFLNYKKEELERISELLKYADTGLILKILPILDNFDLVEKNLPKYNPPTTIPPVSEFNEWVKGVLQIKNQILDFLKKQGVEEIKSVGTKFDPNFQEVVEEVEVEGKEAGIVVEEIQKGYKLQGKVIRPAKVKVVK